MLNELDRGAEMPGLVPTAELCRARTLPRRRGSQLVYRRQARQLTDRSGLGACAMMHTQAQDDESYTTVSRSPRAASLPTGRVVGLAEPPAP